MGAVVLLPLAAILVLAWLAIRRRAAKAFERAAVRGEGVITDVRDKRVGPLDDRDVLAYPLVRITLPDGLTVESWAERPVDHGEVGDRVEVLYLPAEPGRIRINGG
jgi:hypothetical protein